MRDLSFRQFRSVFSVKRKNGTVKVTVTYNDMSVEERIKAVTAAVKRYIAAEIKKTA